MQDAVFRRCQKAELELRNEARSSRGLVNTRRLAAVTRVVWQPDCRYWRDGRLCAPPQRGRCKSELVFELTKCGDALIDALIDGIAVACCAAAAVIVLQGVSD